MLKKGTKNVRWKERDVVGNAEKIKWYDTINYETFDPPKIPRSAKGTHVEFNTYADLGERSLEIKEACPALFGHTNDVHRNAHYIGTFILECMYVKNKKFSLRDAIEEAIRPEVEMGQLKEFFRDQFMKLFDQYASGIISISSLVENARKISDQIDSNDLREWFEKDCEEKMNNAHEIVKSRNKIRMQKVRAIEYKAKEMGISVVS